MRLNAHSRRMRDKASAFLFTFSTLSMVEVCDELELSTSKERLDVFYCPFYHKKLVFNRIIYNFSLADGPSSILNENILAYVIRITVLPSYCN